MALLTMRQDEADDERRASAHGPEWSKKFHLFDKFKHGATNGFLDAGSGITLADKVRTLSFPCASKNINSIHVGMRVCAVSMSKGRCQVCPGTSSG